MAATKSRSADVQSFLDQLDSYAVPEGGDESVGNVTSGSAAVGETTEDAQSVLDFLDEITQRSSTPTQSVLSASTRTKDKQSLSRIPSRSNVDSSPRKSSEYLRPANKPVALTSAPAPAAPPKKAEEPKEAAAGGWGWGSVWSQASNVIQQARTVAEENIAKNLPANASNQVGEQAKKWSEGMMGLVKNVNIENISHNLRDTSLKALTDIINAVAPPISEHEVIQVWLSHDMVGYEGVESLVYKAMGKVMEQVQGGDLIVNRGNEERPADRDDSERNLNTVSGFEEAYKLAQANLDALIKDNFKKAPEEQVSNSTTLPITNCPVYMRIQPCIAALPYLPASDDKGVHNLFFLLMLRDPTHNLSHYTLTQCIPSAWLDIPFEENEWVEDYMVDMIRKGIEIIGQEYILGRQQGRALKAQALKAEITSAAQEKADPAQREQASVAVGAAAAL